MLQLMYALKKRNNWRFIILSQPRISFERTIVTAEKSATSIFYPTDILNTSKCQ
jgi:hypothetical protein